MPDARKIFNKNFVFKDSSSGKYGIGAWSLMCWREAFKWGFDWRQTEIAELTSKLKEAKKLIDVSSNCKGAEHWYDNELKMCQWLEENKGL